MQAILCSRLITRSAVEAQAFEPKKVVDATPAATEAVEPLQQPGACVPSPKGIECAGEREVPVTEPEPADIEEPQENLIGSLC
jgi:hypothetical protein